MSATRLEDLKNYARDIDDSITYIENSLNGLPLLRKGGCVDLPEKFLDKYSKVLADYAKKIVKVGKQLDAILLDQSVFLETLENWNAEMEMLAQHMTSMLTEKTVAEVEDAKKSYANTHEYSNGMSPSRCLKNKSADVDVDHFMKKLENILGLPPTPKLNMYYKKLP